VIVLGVWRSGTTLIKEIFDHHSQVAIPGESYFLPTLWVRYRAKPDIDRLLADIDCVPQVREWGVRAREVRALLPDRPTFADVVQALYGRYARGRGKPRFGDKTPHYMRHLEVLEIAFSRPRYVHIVRDGRDAALSFAAMRAKPRARWIWPRGIADFACRWRHEVEAARAFGAAVGRERYLELRYEDLVARPEAVVRDVCDFLDLSFEPAMLDYHRDRDLEVDPNHSRLAEPVSPGLRDWRTQMRPVDVARFEAIAGPLLGDLGYDRTALPPRRTRIRCFVSRAVSQGRIATGLPVPLFRRSFLWRPRQKRLLRREESRGESMRRSQEGRDQPRRYDG
jgi:hypothetical protein